MNGSSDADLRNAIAKVDAHGKEIRIIYVTWSFMDQYLPSVSHSKNIIEKSDREEEVFGCQLYGHPCIILPKSRSSPATFWIDAERKNNAYFTECKKVCYIGSCISLQGHNGKCNPKMEVYYAPKKPLDINKENCARLGGHCWEESEATPVGGQQFHFRICKHCGMKQEKGWRNSA